MLYRYLGNTGLRVSVVSYGNWVGSKAEEDYIVQRDIIKAMHEAGVNFFDTAEMYSGGESEKIMGRAFKELALRREDLVISTKLFKFGPGVNDGWLSRKHIIEGARNSLKRLQTDYADIIMCHRPDYTTPLEETCRAMSWLIDQNMCLYWGTSEWPADRLTQTIEMCEKLGLHKPICDQCQYSMLWRKNMEKDMRRVFSEYKYGTTIWSPLASGILSGKYNDGKIPEDSRIGQKKAGAVTDMIWNNYMGPTKLEDTCKKLNLLGDYAKEIGYTQAQVAIAWVIANTDVSTALLGFSRLSQVEENLKAVELLKKWTPEMEKKVNEILGNGPEADMDWRSW